MLPAHVALVLAIGPVVGLLLWELSTSRRELVQEHAAHMSTRSCLADMSHELRTPLNAILGFSEMIKDEVLGPCGNDKYREFAADIHQASSHLLHLINDVLDLSKIEAGRLELNESETDLRNLLQSCQRLMQEQARRGGVLLTLDVAPGLHEIWCDPLKVKQVVLNLMSNAIKFTHRGGCVWVRAYHGGGSVNLSVSDNGVGIPANEIAKVLTPFAQAAHTRLINNEGTGLGLPLAKRLMELHGGRLELSSDVGVGTRVTVTFPPERCLRPPTVAPTTLCEAAATV
ncbi:MAG TPA: HAMP domain-containing sensor histidine kinase [Magnetospirillum sp.]|nr:HAMP domain-containing sensor histidine kinase [Magnetospirillum sp.]